MGKIKKKNQLRQLREFSKGFGKLPPLLLTKLLIKKST